MLAVSMCDNNGAWVTKFYPSSMIVDLNGGTLLLYRENGDLFAGLSADMWSTFGYISDDADTSYGEVVSIE